MVTSGAAIGTMNCVETFLRAEGLLDSGAVTLRRLTGGYWNAVYRLTSERHDWVVKVFNSQPSIGLYPVLPDAEAAALRALAGLAIAPQFVAYFSATATRSAILVYEFFAGETWVDAFAEVAHLLRRVHTHPVAHRFRQLPTTPDQLLTAGDKFLAHAAHDANKALLQTRRPLCVSVPPSLRVLVHTDAWLGNFIQGNAGVRLIDWQCPGLGDGAEDVWTFAFSGYELLIGRPPFTPEQQTTFLQAYADPNTLERMHLLSPFFAYRVAAYSCYRIQQLRDTNPAASAGYQRVFEHLLSQL